MVWLLAPLAAAYCAVAGARRFAYTSGLASPTRVGAPVIVVGNITAGGTGKTPLVIWLCEFLRARGFRPGVLCRGYGGGSAHWPQQVRADGDPVAVGDEAVLLARRCGVPVAASPDRVDAARLLVEHGHCDVLVSDDGLQHYRLGRDVEIAVVDGERRTGNGLCLPAGPLREPRSRLRTVDLVVAKGAAARGEFAMSLSGAALHRVSDDAPGPSPEALARIRVHGVAGIGHPEQFFATLRGLGLAHVEAHRFADHHPFSAGDLAFGDDGPVVMTEKDAVKCRRFADERHYYLRVEADLPEVFGERLARLMRSRGIEPEERT